jgi:pimeloyl-ACP methyl ester carboxylesterase
MSSPELFFKSINPDAPRTLVLLHGGFCSHHEWDLVSQSHHLLSYHLLIPDLPAHGGSTSASIPFNLPDASSLLADLITKHAKHGKAGLVGLSLGGYTSIYMAPKYPGIVSEEGMFVTGCGHSWPRPSSAKSWGIGMLMFLFNFFIMSLPRPVFDWLARRRDLKVNDDLYEAMKLGASYQLARTIAQSLGEEPHDGKTWKKRYERTQARTCIVAGAMHDLVGACSKRGAQLRKGNTKSRAFKIEGMQHTWSVQDPELFARGVKSWMEHKPLPDEFISLD